MTLNQRRVHLAAWCLIGPLLLAIVVFAAMQRPISPAHDIEQTDGAR